MERKISKAGQGHADHRLWPHQRRQASAEDPLQMIMAIIDGQDMCIPVDDGNRYYQDIVRLGVAITAE